LPDSSLEMNPQLPAEARSLGFSGQQIAHLTGTTENDIRAVNSGQSRQQIRDFELGNKKSLQPFTPVIKCRCPLGLATVGSQQLLSLACPPSLARPRRIGNSKQQRKQRLCDENISVRGRLLQSGYGERFRCTSAFRTADERAE
jgi:hypothetical protein